MILFQKLDFENPNEQNFILLVIVAIIFPIIVIVTISNLYRIAEAGL